MKTIMTFSSFLFFFFFFEISYGVIPQINLGVEKFILKNGLTVLLHEDHSIPMISYHTWYKVGSKDESVGVTGAAHMLEHMMFKGAKKYSGRDFDRILHENGITNNAFTTSDYTGFYQNLPSDKLEMMMDIEVDRMTSLNLSPEDLKSELQVVGEERRMRVEDSPMGQLLEVIHDTVFKLSPYKWPVIGYMKDIQDYTSEKLRFFYQTYYVPNNAVLVLSGDFDSKKTKKLIEKYYGDLPRREIPPRSVIQEPAQNVQYNKNIKAPVGSHTLAVVYHSPLAGHPDSYVMDLIASISAGMESSPLHKKLVVDSRVATSVGAYNMTMQNEGLMIFYSMMKPGQEVKPALDAIYNETWKLRNKKIKENDLIKAKAKIMKSYVDNLTTLDQIANSLAINEILFGDYKQLFKDLEMYDKITIDDVSRVSNLYFNQTQRTIIDLSPSVKGVQ